jgi:pimeloyl-ACP methyl ester carboxylesterase
MGRLKVVLIPGSGGTGEAFWQQEQAFPGVAFGVSLPGHPDGELLETIDECARWIHDDYIPSQGWRPEDVIVGGNSIGAGIALQYGLTYREAPGIISLGGGSRLRVAFQGLAARRRQIAAIGTGQTAPEGRGSEGQAQSESARAEAPEDVRKRQAEKQGKMGPFPGLNDLLACDRFDITDRIHEISMPTLIIVGTTDTQTPVRYSEFLHEKIGGSKLIVIEGAGHGTAGERPDIVNPAIADFMATIEARETAGARA